MTSVQRFFRLLALDRKDISYVYLYAIFSGIITLSLPIGIQAIINLMVVGQPSSALYILIAVITIGTALTGLLTIMQIVVLETIQRRIFARSAFEFSWRIPRFKMEALSGIYPPELINRFFDTLTIQKGMPKILIDFSTAALQIFWGLILLAFYHQFFVFFGLVVLGILFLVFRVTGPVGLETNLKESKYKYMMAHWLEELGRAMNTFKLSVGCYLPLNRTDYLVGNYLDARKKHFRILLTQYSAIMIFKVLVTLSLLILGSSLVINNSISLGEFVAAEIIIILILNSVEKLILSMDTIYDVLTGIEKIGFVTDLPLERTEGNIFAEINNDEHIKVELDEVSFKFKDTARPTVKNISMVIAQKERVCLSGYNGSGKVTLAQIIGTLYSDFSGTVSYNDIPFKSTNIESLRRHIGSFSPQGGIFNGSVFDNITLGIKDLDLKRVIDVARKVKLHEFITQLDKSYDTELLADGLNLPRGIRTKIMLARTIIIKPKLLILESFENYLEPNEYKKIIDDLLDIKNTWTVVAVSNDPYLAQKCDQVYVLKEGSIMVNGPFHKIKEDEYVQQIFKIPYRDLSAA